jgi:hypothetical protein
LLSLAAAFKEGLLLLHGDICIVVIVFVAIPGLLLLNYAAVFKKKNHCSFVGIYVS